MRGSAKSRNAKQVGIDAIATRMQYQGVFRGLGESKGQLGITHEGGVHGKDKAIHSLCIDPLLNQRSGELVGIVVGYVSHSVDEIRGEGSSNHCNAFAVNQPSTRRTVIALVIAI
jgi:hypothetical protein